MMTYEVELVELQAQPVAVVRGHVTQGEIPAFLGGTFGEVLEALADQGLAAVGPPFGRYVPAADGFDVEAGFPTNRPVRPFGRVEACELPGGRAARVLHRGDYGGVAAAYNAAVEWVAAHGYVAAEPPWECYLDGPEVPEPRTVVYLPCTVVTSD
ncbi:MAG TPA: GyrI-like domain-containing protein [Mycobacteriales bacterium]|nr:GyrI-like domain-containing protein [Mycobacteriales bacterium]